MTEQVGSARVLRLARDAVVEAAGGLFQPVRRELGVRAFSVNAYTARAAGDQLIEPHDETGSSAGEQEELYVVVHGHATFVVDGAEIDAPAGTAIFVPEVGSRREAFAVAPATTALVVGAPAGSVVPTSPFEYWYRAEPLCRAGDCDRAIEIMREGLAEWPGHPTLTYNLACYHAVAGDHEQALRHLAEAFDADPRVKEWALGDPDLDAVRETEGFGRLAAAD